MRQIEQLPVDRNSRPLQDVIISNCDELVKQKGESIKQTKTIDSDTFKILNLLFELSYLDKKAKPEKKKNNKRALASEKNTSSESEESDREKIEMKEKKKKKKKQKKQKKKSGEFGRRSSLSSTYVYTVLVK